MLAVLDAATVARLQALVAMAAPIASLAPISEPQVLTPETAAEMKVKKTLSPEHLAAMKAGREAAKLKKQLSAPVPVELTTAAPVANSANKKDARKGGPTAWADWVKKVLAENAAEITAFKETAEKKSGASLKWISENKGKASPEWVAFKQQWAQEHKSASVASVASNAEEVVVLTPAAAAVAVPAATLVPAPAATPIAALAKKRGPKPLVEMSEEELKAYLEKKKAKAAASASASASASSAETEPESEPSAANALMATPMAAPVKKRGPKPLASMTPAERADHDAKVAQRKALKEAKAALAMQSVGGGVTAD